jgi:cell division transport system ATP-binding protein
LEHYAKRFPLQVSGGEQQRAAIARAIVRSPQLLIADEPTANLPPDASWQIVQLLAEINRSGVTVLVATHDREVVDGTRRRVVELSGGRVVRDQRYGTFTPMIATVPAASGSSTALPVVGVGATGVTSSSSALHPILPPTGPGVLGPTRSGKSGLSPTISAGAHVG